MCFSATGSFTLSAILTGAGAASLAVNRSAPHRMFAGIPLLFATQQASEGIVWLTMDNVQHPLLHRFAINVFLGVALVVWPIWVPTSLGRIERDPARQRALVLLAGAGLLVAIFAAYLLLRRQADAEVVGHRLAYWTHGGSSPTQDLFYLAAYIIPAVGPFFVSTTALSRTVGLVLAGSMIATAVIQRQTLTSVWCFFAAVLSALVALIVTREQRIPRAVLPQV
jgi:hypothetical protein